MYKDILFSIACPFDQQINKIKNIRKIISFQSAWINHGTCDQILKVIYQWNDGSKVSYFKYSLLLHKELKKAEALENIHFLLLSNEHFMVKLSVFSKYTI